MTTSTQPDFTESLDGQPENYEARFKGLQREFNKQQQKLEAQQAALQDAEAEVARVKTNGGDALKVAQAEIARVQNDLKTTAANHEIASQQLALTSAELAQAKAAQAARQKLVTSKNSDLLPAFEAGFLRFDSQEDAVFQATIDNYRNFFGKPLVPGSTQQDFSGASVPGVTMTQQPLSADKDALFAYIMNPDNFGKPDFDEKSNLYFSLIK